MQRKETCTRCAKPKIKTAIPFRKKWCYVNVEFILWVVTKTGIITINMTLVAIFVLQRWRNSTWIFLNISLIHPHFFFAPPKKIVVGVIKTYNLKDCQSCRLQNACIHLSIVIFCTKDSRAVEKIWKISETLMAAAFGSNWGFVLWRSINCRRLVILRTG